MEPRMFVATKAFIVHDKKVLLLKESNKYEDGSNSGKYDVVGGRVQPGQHFKESLQREIEEETGMKVAIGKPFFANEWRPHVKGEQWHIVGIFFECHADSDKVILSQDHDNFIWIDPKDYGKHKIIENLNPVFEAYLEKN